MSKVFVVVLLLSRIALADETYAPATPIPPSGDTIAGYHLLELNIQTALNGTAARIEIVVQPYTNDTPASCVRDSLGACRLIRKVYGEGEASALLNTLNTANLSTTSLRKRVITKLVTDGVIPAGGTTSGTPGVPVLPTSVPTATP